MSEIPLSRPSPESPRSRGWIYALLLVLLTLAVHGRDVFHAFVEWDDVALVVQNDMLNPVTPRGVLNVWLHPTTQVWTGQKSRSNLYTPLAYTLWAGVALLARTITPDAHGGTFNPMPFHLLNVLLHVGCVLIVFDILRQLLPLPSGGRAGVRGEMLPVGNTPVVARLGSTSESVIPHPSDSETFASVSRDSVLIQRGTSLPSPQPSPRWGEGACIIGAALFGVHPLQVEPVAWVAGMNNLLAGLFSLTCVAMYVRFLGREGASEPAAVERRLDPHETVQMTVVSVRVTGMNRNAARFYVLALVMLLLAFLSKPTAIVTPLILLAIDALLVRRPMPRVAKCLWPFAAMAIPFVILGRIAQPVGTTIAPPILQRFMVAGDAVGFYLQKLVWPTPLLMDYSRTPQWLIATGGTLGAWLTLAIGFAIALACLRWRRWVLAPIAIFIAGISIVLGFVPFDYQQYSTVADRYVYLSMLGPAIFVAIGLARLHRRGAMAVVGAMVLIFAAVSFRQVGLWQDTISLCRYTVEHNPHSLAAYSSLGTAHRGQGNLPLAKMYYEKSLEIRPDDRVTNYNYGNLLLPTDPAGAIEHYNTARAAGYDGLGLILNTGQAWFMLGRIDKAVDEFQTVLKMDPQNVPARINLGNCLGAAGDLDGAERYFQEALQIDPNSALAARGIEKVRAVKAGHK